MLTNEQIINILKTWGVHYANISDNYTVLILVDRTLDYQLVITIDHKDNVILSRQITFCKKYDNHYSNIYSTNKIDDDIFVEFDYLVIIKATDWVKTNINLGLTVEQAVGFDALV